MNARHFFPVAFAALFVIAGCALNDDPPKAQPEKPKTKAELLVGTWERIEHDPSVSADSSSTIKYTADGKWFSRTIAEAGAELQLRSGTYVLEGDIIRMTRLSATHLWGDERIGDTWEVQIESISETERVTLGPPSAEGKRTRSVSRRVNLNKL